MIERRGFLSFLGAGVAGLMLPEVMIVDPKLFRATDPLLGPSVGIRALTEAFSAEFERAYEGLYSRPTYFVNSGKPAKVGVITDGTMMEEQHQVVCHLSPECKGLRDRYIVPTAEIMARSIAHAKINAFATLEIPPNFLGHIVTARNHAVRGLLWTYFDPLTERIETRLRFDMMGGRR